MSKLSFLQDAYKLLKLKGTEAELNAIAKKLNPSELEQLSAAYKAQFKPGYFHGTPSAKPFDAFDLNKSESGYEGGSIGASFVTEDPKFAKEFATSKGSVLPLRVKIDNIFDYENPEHIKKLAEEFAKNPKLKELGRNIHKDIDGKPYMVVNGRKVEPFMSFVRNGDWEVLEHPETVKVIKSLGFDGMNVAETGRKNTALFDPNVDARLENAEFNPLKKDTGNLLSSLGIATGAGVAASTMMPEKSEASIPTNIEHIAKIVGKLKNPSPKELLKELNFPKVYTSSKQIEEANDAATKLLDFAIREGTGSKMSDKPETVMHRWIDLARPELKNREGEIVFGIGDKRGAETNYLDTRIEQLRKYDPSLSYSDALAQARDEISNARGMYSTGNKVIDLNKDDSIYSPGKIYVFDDMASTLEHEANHRINHATDPIQFNKLNSSYVFSPNARHHIETDPGEAIRRIGEFSGLSLSDFGKELEDMGFVKSRDGGIYLNPGKENNLKKYLNQRFKLLPPETNYAFGNHFLDYNHFEPERASEILSERIKMPVRNPIENEVALKRLTEGDFPEEQVPEILEKMKERGKTEEIPAQFLDYKKREYERPVFDQPKPKLMSSEKQARLEELRRKREIK